MMSLRFVLFVVATCTAASSFGQDWHFTRQSGPGVFVLSEEHPIANSDYNTDMDQATGEILVNIATNASASDSSLGEAFAQSTSMAQSSSLTPAGATTFAPTVDTTVTNSSSASASAPEFGSARVPVVFAWSNYLDRGGVTASSNSSYNLAGTSTSSGFLHGSMYLFGAVTGSESSTGQASGTFTGDGTLEAFVGEYSVKANYNGTMWAVDVNLPDVTEDFFAPSLNHFFTFRIPVTLPDSINLKAESKTSAHSMADADSTEGGSGEAQGIVNLSASAWAAFTPTDMPLPDGDFDGDGDVDGTDFLSFQRGFGESMAHRKKSATLL